MVEEKQIARNHAIHLKEYYEKFGKPTSKDHNVILELANHVINLTDIDLKHKVVETLQKYKLEHELPNDNDGQYNYGYVKAINNVINLLTNINLQTTIWEFVYSADIESGARTISVHETKEGAETAMELHKHNIKADHEKERELTKQDGCDTDFYDRYSWDHDQHWYVREITLQR